jgi:RNA polymerase sigma-70 factor (ECF subfamily)
MRYSGFFCNSCQQIALLLDVYVEESMSSATIFNMAPPPAVSWIEEIFREYYQLVYRTARVVTGNADDAQDVLQTIFMRLQRQGSPPDFKEPKAYFYRAAVRTSLNLLRSRRRHVLIADSDFFETRRAESADSEIDDSLRSQLYRAIDSLSPRTTEILLLRYVEDLTEPQIAKMLGISRGTVAVTLFRALVRLRKLLRSSS